MTVYIDSWGHLFSDQSIAELWSLAKRIGLKAEWNHYSKGFPHFDLTTEGKKKLAVAQGAKALSVRDPAWRSITGDMMRETFNRAWHDAHAVWFTDKGLVGQGILRLDIPATISREHQPTRQPPADVAGKGVGNG